MKIGRRLAIKVLNASKFVLGRLDGRRLPGPADVTEPLDRDLLALLGELVGEATRPSRATTTPAPSSAPRRSSGRSATTTSSS